MKQDSVTRWKEARGRMVERWEKVLDRIAEHDEAGVRVLTNVLDEFCDQASEDQALAPSGRNAELPVLPATHPPAGFGKAPVDRCLHCLGFSEFGGCSGTVDSLNRAVLDSDWEGARVLAERFLVLLDSMTFPSADPA